MCWGCKLLILGGKYFLDEEDWMDMPRLDLRPKDQLESIGELPSLLEDYPSDYKSVQTKGCFVHSDLLDIDKETYDIGEDEWANLLTTAVFEARGETHELREISRKGRTVLYEARLEPSEFLEKMKRLSSEGCFSLGKYSVRFASPNQLSNLKTNSEYHSSDIQRYDSLPKKRPNWFYQVSQNLGDLSWKGEALDERALPGPFHRLDETPPAANLFDAVKSHTFLDARSGQRGKLCIYQPFLDYRIQDQEYDQARGELLLRLDGRENIDADSGLSLQVISNLGGAASGIRVQQPVTSATETVELQTLPGQTCVVLSHEDDGIIDFRRLSPDTGPNEFMQKASDLARQNPFMAAPLARMGLLRHFRRQCEEEEIPWEEDDDVRDLLHKLMEQGVVSDTQGGLIRNYWIERLGAATHLQTSELTGKELSSIVDQVAQFTRQGDMPRGGPSPGGGPMVG